MLIDQRARTKNAARSLRQLVGTVKRVGVQFWLEQENNRLPAGLITALMIIYGPS